MIVKGSVVFDGLILLLLYASLALSTHVQEVKKVKLSLFIDSLIFGQLVERRKSSHTYGHAQPYCSHEL